MKILVCISKAPDTTSKIAFTDNNTRFDENGVQFIVNPYDEWYALVRGLELKEANGGSVTIVTVGKADAEPIMRKALAIGADEAVRIDSDPTDALFVAKQIAAHAKEVGYDMILTGKETIDYNGSQVGGMIAELLDWPYLSLAIKLEMNGSTASITREVQGGTEDVEVNGSFVLSAAKGMAEQRIPNMRGIMAARTKPLQVKPAADTTIHTQIASYTLPPAKGDCKYVDAENAAQLIEMLHKEAKVI
ncbi:MAG: electron transfer flavoprotein beta subunit/FixA family protein [Cryomorphaceae bacterium]|nr:MAG: electron transfer flavoprotein beta subunit/FixA family protein [Cryomorphaceae bacterium]